MTFNTYIGWDIGGAHLKMASVDRGGSINLTKQLPTPLWQGLDSLKSALSAMRHHVSGESVTHTITMTAELTDIFKDRKSGVKVLSKFLAKHFHTEDLHLYAGNSGLIRADEASVYSMEIASANWHASARFVADNIDKGVFIDIGSTTTDIIPFASGQLLNIADTDYQRLRENELLYTGIIRTPVMAVTDKIFYARQWQNIVAEKFSTMADIYRLTGDLNEADDMLPTADGAGKKPSDSARRLARMIGLDLPDENNLHAFINMAKHIANLHFETINKSLSMVLSRVGVKPIKHLVAAGAGRFLVRKLALKNNLEYIDFTELLSYPRQEEHKVLSCAAAVAVAQITRAVH